ncbi:hypothetical protein ABFS83_01G034800 [Erythranthe nasuta]
MSMAYSTVDKVIPPFTNWRPQISRARSFPGRRRRIVTTNCSLYVSSSTASHRNLIEKIRERITDDKVEISPSAYDTAWVAMVPASEYYSGGSGGGGDRPCFPQCLDWIMENQNPDGSWGLDPDHPFLVKDRLSCTLACVLALRKWDVGQQLVQNGMDFIASNGWETNNNDQFSPVGFDIIFPWMVNYAKELDLILPSSLTSHVDSLLHIQDPEIRRKQNVQVYALEGLGKSCNWKGVISEHQRSNGSLFNSPATTAASLIHFRDEKCFEYLISVLKANNRKGWVPTIYPMDIYTRLCVVDTLERLGINKYFESELGIILDEIYRRWLEKEDGIFSDINSHAIAFRLLRTRGYDVSSDELAEYVDEENFLNTVSIQYDVVTTVLELYRASQARVCEEGNILDRIDAWTSAFLKQQLLNQTIPDERLRKQVDYDVTNFYGALDRIRTRRSIELYDARDFRILKTAYRFPTVHNEDFLRLSVHDYGVSQAQYQKELQQMERWYAECRLDLLNKGRNTLQISYIVTAAIIVDPKLSAARISYAQATSLISCFDDFFDDYGSREEALRIIELVTNWNVHAETSYCSREVEILFTALYNTVNEVAAKAYAEQGYCIRNHLVNMWVELLTNSARGKLSWSESNAPTITMDEYLSFVWKSIGCIVCIFPSIQFLGVKLSEDISTSNEFNSLCVHSSLACRLLNDLKTFEM